LLLYLPFSDITEGSTTAYVSPAFPTEKPSSSGSRGDGAMAESGASLASMVLKKQLQNADDAGATEVSVMLDQRPSSRRPAETKGDLLLSPAKKPHKAGFAGR
jgi:hypothetical protein